jgi:hypothetical protein
MYNIVNNCLKNGVVTLSIPLPLTNWHNNTTTNNYEDEKSIPKDDSEILLDQLKLYIKICIESYHHSRKRSLKNLIFFLPSRQFNEKTVTGDRFSFRCTNIVLNLFKGHKIEQLINEKQ